MGVRNNLPSLFIGSPLEGEGLEVAEYLQAALEDHCKVTLSGQGPFVLGQSYLESLASACKHSDFAAFILTLGDVVTQEGGLKQASRDNVLFEIGFFMGGLGRHRTFIVFCQDDESALPPHFRGVTLATFRKSVDKSMTAAISPVAIKIRDAIEKIRNSENAQTSTQNMLREFVKYNNVVYELKQAHHMLQELAIPLDSLVFEFKISSAWREKPPSTEAIEAIATRWGAVRRRFEVIRYFAHAMTSSKARSLFNQLIRLKKDFEATLKEAKPVRLYDLSLELSMMCQATLDIIDKLMLEQFNETDRITEKISRSINDDPTQS